MLQENLKNNPLARQIIIAHTHGGNLVSYALKNNPDLHASINTFVCLSTPFMDVESRKLESAEKVCWLFLNFLGFITLIAGALGLAEILARKGLADSSSQCIISTTA